MQRMQSGGGITRRQNKRKTFYISSHAQLTSSDKEKTLAKWLNSHFATSQYNFNRRRNKAYHAPHLLGRRVVEPAAKE